MDGTDIAFPNLGIYLHNVPDCIHIFGIEIALYGLIIGVGMILAFILILHDAKKAGLKPDDFLDVGIFIIIFGIIGARLYYVIFSWDSYKDDLLSIFNIRQGGLAIYGGVIAGSLTMLVYCKIKKKPLFKMSDIAFEGVLVGQIVGRWGNFFNREVFGTYTDNVLAMRLPIEAVRHKDIDEAIASHIEPGTNYIQVHPTFLYESFCNLMLLVIILICKKWKKYDGQQCVWYFGGYGIIRFIIEGIRTDRLLIGHSNIAVSQLLGLMLFVVAVVIDIVVRVKISKGKIAGIEKNDPDTDKAEEKAAAK